ncbi:MULTISPECIES: hypothetical protein [unclassified Dietzia]|uniref:hypothetical protein n=1 Tax=unclassified Dietzia TaxID=2617939 RepID=UPI0012E72E64|nr:MULTISPECIES: hypothetical protein [unclassified Dietzia]
MTDDSSKSVFSRELKEAVGYVILEAADAEDSIAELLVLRSGLEAPDKRWWRSGTSLAEALEALEALGDDELCPISDGLRELRPSRNRVVHGLFLEGNGMRLAMLRSNATEPSFEVTPGWSGGALADLAYRFRVLVRMADDAISDAMGLERSPGSPLPPRKAPVVPPNRV